MLGWPAFHDGFISQLGSIEHGHDWFENMLLCANRRICSVPFFAFRRQRAPPFSDERIVSLGYGDFDKLLMVSLRVPEVFNHGPLGGLWGGGAIHG